MTLVFFALASIRRHIPRAPTIQAAGTVAAEPAGN
jgi:hypothetical protein